MTCQADEAILVQEYAHGRNDRRDQHVDPEIVFVALVQCGPLDVFLDDVLVLWALNPALHDAVDLALRLRIRVLHCRVDALLDLHVFVESLSVPLVRLVELDAHFLDFAGDEDAAALRP